MTESWAGDDLDSEFCECDFPCESSLFKDLVSAEFSIKGAWEIVV